MKNFFENLIKDKFKYTIITKKRSSSIVRLVDKSNYIVSINSSLAYEALPRKKKLHFYLLERNFNK